MLSYFITICYIVEDELEDLKRRGGFDRDALSAGRQPMRWPASVRARDARGSSGVHGTGIGGGC